MEATQESIHRWMDEENVLHVSTMDYHSKKKKKGGGDLTRCTTQMDLEAIMLREINR